MSKITVALVDDHQIVRDGIKALLEGQTHIEVVAEASTASEMLEKLESQTPQIAIVDISLPGISGISTANKISRCSPT